MRHYKAALERAVTARNVATVHQNIGSLYLKPVFNDVSSAIRHLENSDQLFPNNLCTLAYLGRAWLKRSIDKSIDIWNRAIALPIDPANPHSKTLQNVLFGLAVLHYVVKQNLDSALACLMKCAEMECVELRGESYLLAAAIWHKKGDMEQHSTMRAKTIEILGDIQHKCLISAGLYHWECGDLAKAKNIFTKCKEKNKNGFMATVCFDKIQQLS